MGQCTSGSINNIPVNTPPTLTSQLTSLRTPANAGDNYGQRIRGYICAPVTQSIFFFIQGDDQAELYLSTDNNPANKRKIASVNNSWSWTEQATQQSEQITLFANTSYYVEVLHKERAAGDVVRVGWRQDQASEPVIIPGSVLSPFVASTAGVAAARNEQGSAASETSQFCPLKAYPNPTNSTTTVAFTAKESGWLGVQLYNLQGQLIRQVFGQQVEAGSTHQRSLEGSSLPSGLYLLRLVNGQQLATQKLIIAR